ncbi:dynein light chain 1, cytoplasmic-like [Carlito syrichta]|uniref:Dynein light chain n=1 Tax=Carlito syrichta TaxID=1868482 RepID=A0A3Q0E695_CARSF|nr:dynein light chain 1, cytoplasmic-like [Carlito syrichta]
MVTTCDRKAMINTEDMSEQMQQDSVECTTQVLEKYIKKDTKKDTVAHKEGVDKKYNPTWHCIMARNFGNYMTHETKHFSLVQTAILLFKSG